MTLPNGLSLVRMGLVPWFVLALLKGWPGQALAVFVLAGLTDLVDGFLARSLGQTSRVGAYLDPIADKLLLVSAFVLLALPGGAPPRIPLWIAVVVIARDVLILVVALVLFVAAGQIEFPPSRLGRASTLAQVLAIGTVLTSALLPSLERPARVLLWVVAGLALASGFQYLWRADRMVGGGTARG